MLSNKELSNAIKMYEIMKKDLYAFLVKKAESHIEYEGHFSVYPYSAYFEYPIKENRDAYELLLDVGKAIENMLKTDIRIWNKTRGIKSVEVAPDRGCQEMIVEIDYLR